MEISDKNQTTQASLKYLAEHEAGGFSFDNYQRNAHIFTQLGGKAIALPTAWKTGTTIVGIIYKNGIVLGADTRATGGSGQELREDPLPRAQHLVLRCWHCR